MATAKKKSRVRVTARKPAASKSSESASPRAIKKRKPIRQRAVGRSGPGQSALLKSSPSKSAKAGKPKKNKIVRGSFSIPKVEYTGLQALKRRAAAGGTSTKKSEIVRAGLKVLASLADAGFAAALRAVPSAKKGRKKSGKVAN